MVAAVIPLLTISLDDPDTERVRRNLVDAVGEIQKLPVIGSRIISDVTLADGVATPVAHGLGRVPQMVNSSPPRGGTSTGRIQEIRDGAYDRSKYVTLKATGWTTTIVVDVEVK